jgi:hypothetical protein
MVRDVCTIPALCLGKGGQPVKAPEREAAILELSVTLHEAKLQAKRLTENMPEMRAVAEAIRHADTMLDMVWDLHECTTLGDTILDHDWRDATDY